MKLIADILMIVGTFSVALYCIVLSRRLSRFTDLEKGVGGAIAVLSAQVDDMTKMLTQAQKTAAGSAVNLEKQTATAVAAASRLELLMASMHDLPQPETPSPATKETQKSQQAEQPKKDASDTFFSSRRHHAEAAE